MAISPLEPQRKTGWLWMAILLLLLLLSIVWFVDPLGETDEAAPGQATVPTAEWTPAPSGPAVPVELP